MDRISSDLYEKRLWTPYPLRVKHFTPEFVGWEEKNKSVDFPLIKVGEREAYFNGLTIRRPDDDTLQIYLAMTSRDGKRREERLEFTRYSAGSP